MADPTRKTIKRLFALSGNVCAFPGCQSPIIDTSDVVIDIICHIKAREKGGPRFDPNIPMNIRNGFDNLMLMCQKHHKIVDELVEQYIVEALKEIIKNHEYYLGRSETEKDSSIASQLLNNYRKVSIVSNSGNIVLNNPGAIQGGTININTNKRNISINAPPGTIGFQQSMRRYIEYLIKRYNNFAGSDTSRKTKFIFSAISHNIETNFGAKWSLLPEDRFNDVVNYLHSRISKTMIARINKGKGQKSFSTNEEYKIKNNL